MHRIARSCVLFLWIHTLAFVKSQNRPCTLESFLKSDKYDGNFDTTTLEDSYPSGGQVRVGCVVGHSGFFKMTCVNGRWEYRGTNCQPRSCGHPGDAQFADFQLVEGDDFVFGSQVTYTCHKGYQMISRKNYRTCLAGGWDGSVPVCEAQSCQSFDVPNNIVVNGDTQDATYGNVVRFNCRSNTEVLYGSQEMYCDENGKWVGEFPRCEAVKCTVPDIDNGYVPGGSHAQVVYNEHEILHFACNDLYKRAEDRPSKCTKIGDKPEFIPTPACVQIKCKLDQMTPAGTTYAPAYRNMFLPGETLTVTCGDKYYFSHFRETSAEVTCKEDGQWTRRPVCKEVICDRRDPHARFWNTWRQIKLEETTDYWCEDGYKKTSASGRAECTRDGWAPNPLCEEITCDREDIKNADIVNGKLVYKNKEEATYRCKEGYRGDPTLTCGANGWSGHSQCTEIRCYTKNINNADIVNDKGVYKYKQKAYYRCKKGYRGNPTRICGANGLSGNSRCTEVTCNREYFDNATPKRRKTTYRYGEDAEFTCSDHVRSFTRTCGENGWTGSKLCSTCPKAKVKNGFVLPSSTDPDTLRYACNKGFKPFTKGWWGEAKCKDRVWVGLGPCIEEGKCGEFPAIPNGAMSRQQARGYEHDEAVWINCKEGYRPQVELLTCDKGNWSAPPLETICAFVGGNCKPPPAVENAVVETPHQDEYANNSPVTYKCRDNYTIEGGNRLVCRNGNWEESNIKCSPPADPPAPPASKDSKDPAAPATPTASAAPTAAPDTGDN